jgi:hypothetical protein
VKAPQFVSVVPLLILSLLFNFCFTQHFGKSTLNALTLDATRVPRDDVTDSSTGILPEMLGSPSMPKEVRWNAYVQTRRAEQF